MNTKIKRITFIGLMASLAIVLSYLEFLIPPIFTQVPGIKMGLPNIVVIFMLYRFGLREAIGVSSVRLICTSLLFGSITAFLYGLLGAALSLTVMAILKKTDIFSSAGVSVAGGIFHNVGQIIVAILLLGRAELGYYLIVLSITGTLAGLLVGLVGSLMLKITKNIKI